jgi:hypothetical protein
MGCRDKKVGERIDKLRTLLYIDGIFGVDVLSGRESAYNCQVDRAFLVNELEEVVFVEESLITDEAAVVCLHVLGIGLDT